jgi:endonuclease/exonuclease/phosphatase family metal-dependent hydrolase
VKIATWNVAYGRGSANQLRLKQIQEVDADIWVLTETHDDLDLGPDFCRIQSLCRSDEDSTKGNRNIDEMSRWVTLWVRQSIFVDEITIEPDRRSAACLIASGETRLVVYGLVLPWYNDQETESFTEEIERHQKRWMRFVRESNASLCVAGDFNVNLGGPHYYGAAASRSAINKMIQSSELTVVTRFRDDAPSRGASLYGLIDHIALSKSICDIEPKVERWSQKNGDGRAMSDHDGTAIQFG